MKDPASDQVTPARLYQVLVTYFSDGDLRALCRDLSIDWAIVPGQGKRDKVRALIASFERRHRVLELVVGAKQLRPDAPWRRDAVVFETAPVALKPSSADRLLVVKGRQHGGSAERWGILFLSLLAVGLVIAALRVTWPALGGTKPTANASPTRYTPAAMATLPPATLLTPTPMPTFTPIPSATPTPLPTFTSVPSPSPTPSSSPTTAPTSTSTYTPLPTATPTPSATPAHTTTATATATRAIAGAAVPVSRITSTPTPLPAPTLIEPEGGASFPDRARFKFVWYRRLGENERFSVYVQSAHAPDYINWWATEANILHGGGSIYTMEGGVLYEVNLDLEELPKGEAFWRVAVVGETPYRKWQISPWSEERQIFRLPWPGKRVGLV